MHEISSDWLFQTKIYHMLDLLLSQASGPHYAFVLGKPR